VLLAESTSLQTGSEPFARCRSCRPFVLSTAENARSVVLSVLGNAEDWKRQREQRDQDFGFRFGFFFS